MISLWHSDETRTSDRRAPAALRPRSVRPGHAASESEIVRIRQAAAGRRVLSLEHLVGDAVALAIGDRLLLGVEVQPQLLFHVGRARPAHQWLDLARGFRLVVEHPALRVRGAGLHRRLGRLVDARDHGLARLQESAGLVGAAGFEPATWSTQNSRATRLRYAPPLVREYGARYTVRPG